MAGIGCLFLIENVKKRDGLSTEITLPTDSMVGCERDIYCPGLGLTMLGRLMRTDMIIMYGHSVIEY